jgi:Fibronectin type III domain
VLTLASFVLLASAGVAQAHTIIVNTTSDPSGTNGCLTDGTCSLRDAVAAASSGDTIELGGTSGSPEVYSLTQGTDIQITTSLTLEGGGVTATSIDGSENDGGQGQADLARILRVDGGATVTIQNLAFTGGTDYEDEYLQSCQNNCYAVNENGGGALFNDGGNVTLDDVDFTDNSGDNPVGGGVSNGSGTLNMTNVSFTNDNAYGGGGLFTRSGTVTGTGLTFQDDGPDASNGGAAYLLGGTVLLTNVTVVGSGSPSGVGGGIVNSGAMLTLINDTFSGNVRGSIDTEQGATTSVGNTIIGAGFSDNVNYGCVAAGQGDDVSGNTSTAAITTDLGSNIDQDGHCGLSGPGDQTDVDPELAPIANNGGPTLTQALLAGSPALGAANEANCPTTDQRGELRASPCDIGAFEAQFPPVVSDVSVPSVTQTSGTIDFSIDPEGPDTTYVIDYGLTSTYGQQTQPVDVGSGSGAQPLQATITELSPGTTYHFEVVATNAYGNGASSDNTMTTVQSTSPPPPPPPPPPSLPAIGNQAPTVTGSTSASFSGFVNPEGSSTSAYFEYGLDPTYTGSGGAVVYSSTTPAVDVGSDSTNHQVSASVSGLVPNALYHVRLVATSSVGTTYGPDQTFRTSEDPPPLPPVLGTSFDAVPVSGLVFVKLPGVQSSTDAGAALGGHVITRAVLTRGAGFVPLTEDRQLPAGTQIDARQGTLKLLAASGAKHGKPQTGTFSGGLFTLAQARTGPNKGLTSLSILEGAFPGAPTLAACKAEAAADPSSPSAHAAKLSSEVLQTLLASATGEFMTRGRYGAATARGGAAWSISDRCDGTLITVKRHRVLVTNFVRQITLVVHVGGHYLAKAP